MWSLIGSFRKNGTKSHVGDPSEGRKSENAQRHKRRFAAPPTSGGAQKHHYEIEQPGDERETDLRVHDPACAGFDESPGAAGDGAKGDEHEAKAHGIRDE